MNHRLLALVSIWEFDLFAHYEKFIEKCTSPNDGRSEAWTRLSAETRQSIGNVQRIGTSIIDMLEQTQSLPDEEEDPTPGNLKRVLLTAADSLRVEKDFETAFVSVMNDLKALPESGLLVGDQGTDLDECARAVEPLTRTLQAVTNAAGRGHSKILKQIEHVHSQAFGICSKEIRLGVWQSLQMFVKAMMQVDHLTHAGDGYGLWHRAQKLTGALDSLVKISERFDLSDNENQIGGCYIS